MEKSTEFINAINEIVKTIPKTILISVIGLLSIMVYWFCSIFLIANDFYLSNHIAIIIAFSFILSVNWYIMNLVLTATQIVSFEYQTKIQAVGLTIEDFFAASATFSILYMSIVLFFAHYWNWSFCSFLLGCYSIILLSLLIMLYNFLRSNRATTQNS